MLPYKIKISNKEVIINLNYERRSKYNHKFTRELINFLDNYN